MSDTDSNKTDRSQQSDLQHKYDKLAMEFAKVGVFFCTDKLYSFLDLSTSNYGVNHSRSLFLAKRTFVLNEYLIVFYYLNCLCKTPHARFKDVNFRG